MSLVFGLEGQEGWELVANISYGFDCINVVFHLMQICFPSLRLLIKFGLLVADQEDAKSWSDATPCSIERNVYYALESVRLNSSASAVASETVSNATELLFNNITVGMHDMKDILSVAMDCYDQMPIHNDTRDIYGKLARALVPLKLHADICDVGPAKDVEIFPTLPEAGALKVSETVTINATYQGTSIFQGCKLSYIA